MGKVSKRIRDGFYGFILRRAPRHALKAEIARRLINAVTPVYGDFLDGDNFKGKVSPNTSSESEQIMGEVVQAIQGVAKPTDIFLLPGERRSSRQYYSQISGVPVDQILTAGLHDDMDFQWDYEASPPADIPRVDLIASHAMIEHLVDPYKHLRDCYALLNPGGHMIFHTVIPGFQYHRYPVDCLRFFPDWFEEVGKRLGAQVAFRSLSVAAHVVYSFRKP